MPTKHRRHAITETPPVKAALDELRAATGEERVDLGELVILGAEQKVGRLRADQDDGRRKRKELADMIRERRILVDPEAAEEVRRTGWARPQP